MTDQPTTERLSYYPIHTADAYADIVDLGIAERGIHSSLVLYFLRVGPIPSSIDELLRIVGFNCRGLVPKSRAKVEEAIRYVLKGYFVPVDERWIHQQWEVRIARANRAYAVRAASKSR